MKTYKTKIYPAREEQVEDKTTCDICGKEIGYRTYKVSECKISMK